MLVSDIGDQIRIWDTNTGSPLLTLEGHKAYITSVAFCPDGTKIASGSF